jgi:hypothetical protein
MTTTATPRKTKTSRAARVERLGTSTVLWLTDARNRTTAYALTRIASDLGGVAFQLHKAHQGGGEPEVYSVLIHGADSVCDCIGHAHHGRCKHVDGLAALLAAGKV